MDWKTIDDRRGNPEKPHVIQSIGSRLFFLCYLGGMGLITYVVVVLAVGGVAIAILLPSVMIYSLFLDNSFAKAIGILTLWSLAGLAIWRFGYWLVKGK